MYDLVLGAIQVNTLEIQCIYKVYKRDVSASNWFILFHSILGLPLMIMKRFYFLTIFFRLQIVFIIFITIIANQELMNDSSSLINIAVISCHHHGFVLRGLLGSLMKNEAKKNISLNLILSENQSDYLNRWCQIPFLLVLEKEFYKVTIIYYEEIEHLVELGRVVIRLGHEISRFQCAYLKLGIPEIFPDLDDVMVLDAEHTGGVALHADLPRCWCKFV
jgi:hypothetical protein